MSFYFGDELVAKMKSLLPVAQEPKKDRPYVSYIAKEILKNIDVDNIKLDNGELIVCSDLKTTDYNNSSKEERDKVKKELTEEIKKLFGFDAEVEFCITDAYEEEPYSLPPLYFGGTVTIFCYSLSIKVKL